MVMTLLAETVRDLTDNGHTPVDVRWVGEQDGSAAVSWDAFAAAADFAYNNGYGRQEMSQSLVVVGDDWWLERHEHDGKEWWEYLALPRLSAAPERRVGLAARDVFGSGDEKYRWVATEEAS